ncbi:hypothetical protein IGI04_037859 [Brassica rapa subsp. trilocularis]|uniref:Disease resistance R13L4/SHOC-2-like LRR domain-containing protein n=1 Tax=Brassica rapa subsp. trilocularis TaxID=1813537 RepID=A0ABQ7LIL0_BRACM|nr:hypothetical protein IGI04_037859 [Brassica rapa subsp. trilocularis]
MSYVNISSEIPKEFSNMSSLRWLILEKCNLLGIFPSNVFLIPSLHLINLDENPKLRGQLPDFHVNKSLQRISIAQTSFSGTIPSSLGNLSHLSFLRLSYNNFIGEIPSSIGNLKQLISFHVFNNKLSGNFPSALLNLTQLRTLDLSYNQFSGSLPPNISQISRLHFFSVRGNSFVGTIPASLFKISSLAHIDLDINHFSDLLGIENISSLLPNLEYLFLGGNNYSVNVIPVDLNIFPPLKHLSGLSLSGIPLSTTNITSDFSSNLEFLYLSRCKVTEFPEFIRNNPHLHDLALSNNKMKGQVPDWLWRLPELDYLDLSRNSFSEPDYIGAFLPHQYYASIVLMAKGVSMEMERILKVYTAIDFSGNQLHGQIPESIGLLKELRILNMSSNAFTGHIPSSLAKLTVLESLDLSQNKLSGEIPPELGKLSSLEWINVSHNQLVGSIPQGTQFQRQNCSSYEGNPGLLVSSLKDVCGSHVEPTSQQSEQPESLQEEEEEEGESLSWMAAGIGFAPGVVFGITIGYIVALYKIEWFMKIFGRTRTC